MNHLDVCSGIGGFALAASWVWPDHRVVSFVEIDDYCQRVLRKHWPTAPIHSDLRDFDARPLRGSVDLLTGGYPCQPFSHAGKRQGEEDDRHLWPEVRRVAEECRPRWCLFENVAGHITLGLDSVLSDLEGLGYACEAAVIPACAVDAPHRRDRVWIVAYAEREPAELQRGPRAISRARRADEGEARQRERRGDAARSGREALADADRARQLQPQRGQPDERRWTGDGSEEVAVGHTNGTPANAHAETGRSWRATGEPSRWLPEPRVGRVAHGVPNRVDRLRALGNAIVPQVAAEIMRAICLVDEEVPA